MNPLESWMSFNKNSKSFAQGIVSIASFDRAKKSLMKIRKKAFVKQYDLTDKHGKKSGLTESHQSANDENYNPNETFSSINENVDEDVFVNSANTLFSEKTISTCTPNNKPRRLSDFGQPLLNANDSLLDDSASARGFNFVESLSPTFKVEIPDDSPQKDFLIHSAVKLTRAPLRASKSKLKLSNYDDGVAALRYKRMPSPGLNSTSRSNGNTSLVDLQISPALRKSMQRHVERTRKSRTLQKSKSSGNLKLVSEGKGREKLSVSDTSKTRRSHSLRVPKSESSRDEEKSAELRKFLADRRDLSKVEKNVSASGVENLSNDKGQKKSAASRKKSDSPKYSPIKESRIYTAKVNRSSSSTTLGCGRTGESQTQRLGKRKSLSQSSFRTERSGSFRLRDLKVPNALKTFNRQTGSSRLQSYAQTDHANNVVAVKYRKLGTPSHASEEGDLDNSQGMKRGNRLDLTNKENIETKSSSYTKRQISSRNRRVQQSVCDKRSLKCHNKKSSVGGTISTGQHRSKSFTLLSANEKSNDKYFSSEYGLCSPGCDVDNCAVNTCKEVRVNKVSGPIQKIVNNNSAAPHSVRCRSFSDISVEDLSSRPVEESPGSFAGNIGIKSKDLKTLTTSSSTCGLDYLDLQDRDNENTYDNVVDLNWQGEQHVQKFQRQLSWIVKPVEESPEADQTALEWKSVFKHYDGAKSSPFLDNKHECARKTECIETGHHNNLDSEGVSNCPRVSRPIGIKNDNNQAIDQLDQEDLLCLRKEIGLAKEIDGVLSSHRNRKAEKCAEYEVLDLNLNAEDIVQLDCTKDKLESEELGERSVNFHADLYEESAEDMASLKRLLIPSKSKGSKEAKDKGLEKASKSLLGVNTSPKTVSTAGNGGSLSVSSSVKYGKSPSKSIPVKAKESVDTLTLSGKKSSLSRSERDRLASRSRIQSSQPELSKSPDSSSAFTRGGPLRKSEKLTSGLVEASTGFKRNDPVRRSTPARTLSATRSQSTDSVGKSASSARIPTTNLKNKENNRDLENNSEQTTQDESNVKIKPNDKNSDELIDDSGGEKRTSLTESSNIWIKRGSSGGPQVQTPPSKDSNVQSVVSPIAGLEIASNVAEQNITHSPKHVSHASAENLAKHPQRRVGRVHTHYSGGPSIHNNNPDSFMWRTTSHQEVSSSPLNKRSSFDSQTSVLSEPDPTHPGRPNSTDFDSEFSDTSEVAGSKTSLSSGISDVYPGNSKNAGTVAISKSSSNLSHPLPTVAQWDRPQRHSYSMEPAAKLNIFDRLSVPKKNKLAASAPRLDQSGTMQNKSLPFRNRNSKTGMSGSAGKLSSGAKGSQGNLVKDSGSGGSDGEKSSLSRSSSSSSVQSPASKTETVSKTKSYGRMSKASSTSKLPNSNSGKQLTKPERPFSPEPKKPSGPVHVRLKSDSELLMNKEKVGFGSARSVPKINKPLGNQSRKDRTRPFSPEPKVDKSGPFSPESKKDRTPSRPFSPEQSNASSTSRSGPFSHEPRNPISSRSRPFSPEPKSTAKSTTGTARSRPFSPEPKKPSTGPFSPEPRKTPSSRPFSPEPRKPPTNRPFSPEPRKTPSNRPFSPEPKKPAGSTGVKKPISSRPFSPEPAKPKSSAAEVREKPKNVERSKDEKVSAGSHGILKTSSSAAHHPFFGHEVQKSSSLDSVKDTLRSPELKGTSSMSNLSHTEMGVRSHLQHKSGKDMKEVDNSATEHDDLEVMQYTMGKEPALQQKPKILPQKARKVETGYLVRKSSSESDLSAAARPDVHRHRVKFAPGTLFKTKAGHTINPQDAVQLHNQIMEIRRQIQLHQAQGLRHRLIRPRAVSSIPEDIQECEGEETDTGSQDNKSPQLQIVAGGTTERKGSSKDIQNAQRVVQEAAPLSPSKSQGGFASLRKIDTKMYSKVNEEENSTNDILERKDDPKANKDMENNVNQESPASHSETTVASYVKLKRDRDSKKKTTWSDITKRYSDPTVYAVLADSPPSSASDTESASVTPQRISLIDSFYLERRSSSPRSPSLQKFFDQSGTDSPSNSDTNLSSLSSPSMPHTPVTNFLRKDLYDSFSPDTLSIASSSSRAGTPTSDESPGSSSKEASPVKSSKPRQLSYSENVIADIVPKVPPSPIYDDVPFGRSVSAAVVPPRHQSPLPPTPSTVRHQPAAPPVPPHQSRQLSPPTTVHLQLPPSQTMNFQLQPSPSQTVNPQPLKSQTSQMTNPRLPFPQTKSLQLPPPLAADSYDRPLPPEPPQRSTSLEASCDDLVMKDDVPPVPPHRKLPQPEEETVRDAELKSKDDNVSTVANNQPKTAPKVNVRRTQSVAERGERHHWSAARSRDQASLVETEIPEGPEVVFKPHKRRFSEGTNKVSIVVTSEDTIGSVENELDSTLTSGTLTPGSSTTGRSVSQKDLGVLDADSLHRQYAADSLSSNLQKQRDLSVSSPSISKFTGQRPGLWRNQSSGDSPFAKPTSSVSAVDLNETQLQSTPQSSHSGGLKGAFQKGFFSSIQRSSSFKFGSRSKGSSTGQLDKSVTDSGKKGDKEPKYGKKLSGFLNRFLSKKRSGKKENEIIRNDSFEDHPDADAEDDDEEEEEEGITIISPVREQFVITAKESIEEDDNDDEILAQELDPDTSNDTLLNDSSVFDDVTPRSSPDNRNSFIEEHDGLIFFNMGFANRPLASPGSASLNSKTSGSELQLEEKAQTGSGRTTADASSESNDSGSEESNSNSVGARMVRVGLERPIRLGKLDENCVSQESLSSAAASGSDSELSRSGRKKLSRTESFRMPRRPNPDADQQFVRGGIYRGSMPAIKRHSPNAKTGLQKAHIATQKVDADEAKSGPIPRALDLDFIRSTLAKRTSVNSSVPADNLDTSTCSSEDLPTGKVAVREGRFKKQNTFTPEEVAHLAHHMQGMAKYNQDGAKPQGGQVVYRPATGRSEIDQRPKSDYWSGVRTEEESALVNLRRRYSLRERPKSDLGGSKQIGLAMKNQDWRHQLTTQRSFNRQYSDLSSDGTGEGTIVRGKMRRMSTPHPIKMRRERRKGPGRHKNGGLKRSLSAPDLFGRSKSSLSLESAGNSDEVYETMSLQSRRSSQSTIPPVDDILDNICPFAEALWDHVTLDVDELAFRAGDVIEVTDMLDKDWWWGRMDETEGWFPSGFVRLRVNQTDTADDIAVKMREGSMDTSTAMQRVTSGFISKDQARTNVVNEILTVEKDYVRHLLDVIDGYIQHAKKRPEMFSKDRVATIFGNLEQVYKFSKKFLRKLEAAVDRDAPYHSEIGQCFLDCSQGFEVYSEYCNNHPYALCELQMLRCEPKYTQFFEACRLLQEMNEIPLEGFLLTPVQKVCKYPLQLAELLKHTRPEHPDYEKVKQALEAMKGIASLINERKRRMESMEKIALWQATVEGWQGGDLLELSSELIYSGELLKFNLNTSGWVKDRVFFLFDHQLVYCKRDLLRRDGLTYKGRMMLDFCDIISVPDGKDSQFGQTVKNAWKVFDRSQNKCFLLCAKASEDKTKWLTAFRRERKRVKEDSHSGFAFSEQTKRIALQSVKYKMQRSTSETKAVRKVSRGNSSNYTQNPPPIIPPTGNRVQSHDSFNKKRPWLMFNARKTAR